jgi:hypothetical protein
MDPLRRSHPRGVLIVEAVVAAFLMIFAFAAASTLFHSALQWEAQSGNVRRAALIAQKKIGEIRAWSEEYHSSHAFDEGWTSPITGIQADYAEAPGFEIEVIADQPHYDSIPSTGDTPPDGMYSPTSHFWSPPPASAALPNDFENPQKNPDYATFSRVRTFNASYRRVQVIVRYGNGGSREFRAVTLVGDPITPASSGEPSISISRSAGPASVGPGDAADYSVTISLGGHDLDDMVCLWGVDPESTGSLIVKPLDSNGRGARIIRPTWGNAGTSRLAVRIRYRGRQYSKLSDPITVL